MNIKDIAVLEEAASDMEDGRAFYNQHQKLKIISEQRGISINQILTQQPPAKAGGLV